MTRSAGRWEMFRMHKGCLECIMDEPFKFFLGLTYSSIVSRLVPLCITCIVHCQYIFYVSQRPQTIKLQPMRTCFKHLIQSLLLLLLLQTLAGCVTPGTAEDRARAARAAVLKGTRA